MQNQDLLCQSNKVTACKFTAEQTCGPNQFPNKLLIKETNICLGQKLKFYETKFVQQNCNVYSNVHIKYSEQQANQFGLV